MQKTLMTGLLAAMLFGCSATEEPMQEPVQIQTGPLQFINLEASPVVKVPADRWGSLQPAKILLDSTQVQGEPRENPFPFDLDIEGNTLFFGTGVGIKLFDVTNPAFPVARGVANGEAFTGKGIYWTKSDKDFYITNLDAPAGNDDILATKVDEFGFIAWNTTNKMLIDWHYQDGGNAGRFIVSVYAARLADGRDYAFAVHSGKGLVLYDLTSAASQTRCLENTNLGETGCGVFEGVLSVPKLNVGNHVNGLDDLVVLRVGAAHVRIYRVTGPAGYENLTPRLNGTLPGSTNGDAVLWKYDYNRNGTDEIYLAALSSVFNGVVTSTLRIYDVTCVKTGNCSLPAPLATYDVTDHLSNLSKMTNLSISYDGKTPYLYLGNENAGFPGQAACVPQREFPLDLSRFRPSSPPTLAALDLTPAGKDYWGWYYQECHVPGQSGGPGFNDTRPLHAKVKDGYIFRSAYTFADSHRIMAPPTEIFADGFESGNVAAWSNKVP